MAIAIITLAAEEEAPCVRAREGSHTWACRRRREREGGRKKGMLGRGRIVRQLRPSGNKRANAQWAGDGQRYRIADTVWGGGYRSSNHYQTPPCRVGCAPCGCYACGTQHHPSCIAPRCLCRRSKPVPKSRRKDGRKKINNIILSASLPPLRTFLLPLPKSLN